MFLGEYKNWKTIEIRAQANLYCVGLGNPKCQLVALKRYYYETGKL